MSFLQDLSHFFAQVMRALGSAAHSSIRTHSKLIAASKGPIHSLVFILLILFVVSKSWDISLQIIVEARDLGRELKLLGELSVWFKFILIIPRRAWILDRCSVKFVPEGIEHVIDLVFKIMMRHESSKHHVCTQPSVFKASLLLKQWSSDYKVSLRSPMRDIR